MYLFSQTLRNPAVNLMTTFTVFEIQQTHRANRLINTVEIFIPILFGDETGLVFFALNNKSLIDRFCTYIMSLVKIMCLSSSTYIEESFIFILNSISITIRTLRTLAEHNLGCKRRWGGSSTQKCSTYLILTSVTALHPSLFISFKWQSTSMYIKSGWPLITYYSLSK